MSATLTKAFQRQHVPYRVCCIFAGEGVFWFRLFGYGLWFGLSCDHAKDFGANYKESLRKVKRWDVCGLAIKVLVP